MVTAVFAVKRLLDRCEEQHRAAVAAFERLERGGRRVRAARWPRQA